MFPPLVSVTPNKTQRTRLNVSVVNEGRGPRVREYMFENASRSPLSPFNVEQYLLIVSHCVSWYNKNVSWCFIPTKTFDVHSNGVLVLPSVLG